MKDKIKKIIIFIYCIVIAFSITSCEDKTPGLQSQPWSSGEVSETSSVEKVSSEKEDPSGKGNLWADKKLSVGVIGPGSESAWRTASIQNIYNVVKEWNIDMEFADGQCKQQIQIEHLEDLIEKEVDVIGFIPVVEYGWEKILMKVKQAGIPVILIDRTVNCADESLWISHIVNNYHREGQMAGEWLIEYLEKQGKLDEEIKIAELHGSEGKKATKGNKEGFREAIKGNSNIEITISKEGHFIQAKGYEEMSNILQETTDIDVLYCHNDDMAFGAIEAIEEAGLVPGEDIIIVSIMGTNAALEAIVDGKIACSVEASPFMGDLFMEACVRIDNGEEIEREIHPVDRVFDITNAQAELDARKENGYGY